MIKNHRTVRGALSKVTTRYRKEFPKLKLETQGTEGEIEMLRIVYPLIRMGHPDNPKFPDDDPGRPFLTENPLSIKILK